MVVQYRALTKSSNQYDFNLLRALEVFLAVAKHGQMTRAGTAMGITQSAVSQHLNNLEELYATRLIDRAQRPMQLTLGGEALRHHASNILHRVDSINADINQIDQSHIPLLRIGLLPSLATLLTPVLIEQAKSRYRVPMISLYADLSNAHEQMIKSRQVDLLVTSQPFYDLDGLSRQLVLDEEFLLILPPNFDSFGGDLERLARDIPMVRFSESVPAGLLVDRHLRRCNVSIEHFLDADRTTMIMAAVAAGQGFSILSPTLLLDGVIEGMSLKVLPLPIKPLQRSILLVNREAELDQLPMHLNQAITEKLQKALEQLDPVAQQAVNFNP
jgi:DNA-binding transcriptional LysR family regulator